MQVAQLASEIRAQDSKLQASSSQLGESLRQAAEMRGQLAMLGDELQRSSADRRCVCLPEAVCIGVQTPNAHLGCGAPTHNPNGPLLHLTPLTRPSSHPHLDLLSPCPQRHQCGD